MKQYHVHTYEEAKAVIDEIGILPLAHVIPDYPSLDGITRKDSWYTGSVEDPWGWRARFFAEGAAAYGKFLKKKSFLVSTKLLPAIRTVLGSKIPLEERYENGLVSREAMNLFKHISENEGIDTRELRKISGMKDKDYKKDFDRGLLELQGSMDILVSGTVGKINADGEKSGWSSAAYETMDHWMNKHDLIHNPIDKQDAKEIIRDHFSKICSEQALKMISKLFELDKTPAKASR
ncbi:AlkZ-related protein [Falsibacillus pallidus]|uniref:AlkZ-related protein n=1 Tax=Falsibacillus pallidus TaxID=493781 RepID=UPI003D9529AB